MQRRTVLGIVATSVLAPVLKGHGQAPAKPLIGFLCGKSPDKDQPQIAAFWKGLNAAGFVNGANVDSHYEWANGDYTQFPSLARNLVAEHVTLIVGIGTTPAALAAKAATTQIPIVFIVGSDPVQLGLVAALNRPGGNLTGVTFLNRTLVPKQFEILHEILPRADRLGFLLNPYNPYATADENDARKALDHFDVKLAIGRASTMEEVDAAMDALLQSRVQGFTVAGDLLLDSQHDKIISFAARNAIPVIYPWHEAVTAGGLLSYGTSRQAAYEQAGRYAGRILKGAKAGDLPVQQATRFELAMNLKTAKALGMTMPPALLARADDVLE
jgi:putative ABC transport system substrate-binding protein